MATLVRAALVALVVWAGVAPPLPAQGVVRGVACAGTARLVPLDFASSERDLGRILQVSGALPASPALLRRAGTERELPVCREQARFLEWALEDSVHSWHGLRVLPASLEVESNSSYRKDRNNGSLRGGVGASVAAGAGVELRWKGVTAAFAPRVIRDANGDFKTLTVSRPGYSEFAYPYETDGYLLDFPQRFGLDADTRLDPGQSYVRYGSRHVEVGASTENLLMGAGQVYPILVSATAPGLPHLFVATVEPLDVWLARVGIHLVVGRLSESGFFDTNPDNDHRPFSAILVELTPRWTPGLHLGLARLNEDAVPAGGATFSDYFSGLFDTSFTKKGGGNRLGNAIGVLMARWVFPAAGFEAHAEWARDDTPYNLRDLVEEPDWTQAYLLGFSHLVDLDRARLRWYGEMVHLGEAAPVRAGKGSASWYTHNRATHGHTHDGQILGAAAGPGSDAQIFGVDAFHARGRSGLWLERTRYDDDTYYRRWARMYGESRHDVEWGVGARHGMVVRGFRVDGEVLYNRRANRGFLGMEDRTMPRAEESNLGARLRVAWRP